MLFFAILSHLSKTVFCAVVHPLLFAFLALRRPLQQLNVSEELFGVGGCAALQHALQLVATLRLPRQRVNGFFTQGHLRLIRRFSTWSHETELLPTPSTPLSEPGRVSVAASVAAPAPRLALLQASRSFPGRPARPPHQSIVSHLMHLFSNPSSCKESNKDCRFR